jgi:hypothetical protein
MYIVLELVLIKATGKNYSQIAFGLDFKNIQLPIVI